MASVGAILFLAAPKKGRTMAGLPVRLDSRDLACGYDVGSLAQWTFALGLALNPVGWRLFLGTGVAVVVMFSK